MPNWLGDIVMATALINAVNETYPTANVDLIIKKGFDFFTDFLPTHNEAFVFDKKKYGGAQGALKFGRAFKSKKYDLFFCLPNSFSSALMAYGTKAKNRIGYGNELRNVLLTNSIKKTEGFHRVEEYVHLLEDFTGKKVPKYVSLKKEGLHPKNYVVVNINSEADSRRLPTEKAVSLINKLRTSINEEIILIGSPAEKTFVTRVYNQLEDITGIKNMAGETTMPELMDILGQASLLLTTDSGPAHVANALSVKTIVLFGAGNENNTAPYNKDFAQVIRLGQLPCEPCLKNECKLYEQPECLLQLNEDMICLQVVRSLQYIHETI